MEHTNRRLQVKGALSYGVGLAITQLEMSLRGGIVQLWTSLTVAQLGMNLSNGSCLTGDEP